MIRAVVLIFTILFISGTYSCKKPDKHPPEPIIEYDSHSAVSSDTLLLRIGFEDGDGDIGFLDTDTTKNLFLTYMEVNNGSATEIELPIPFSYKVPNIMPSGKNKYVKGIMTIIIHPFYYNPSSNFDAIRYKVLIKDRAGNISNEVETPDIEVIR